MFKLNQTFNLYRIEIIIFHAKIITEKKKAVRELRMCLLSELSLHSGSLALQHGEPSWEIIGHQQAEYNLNKIKK